ncbi:MAG: hypothetical protein C0490_16590 [Marivirga sp.]|nr:hypothetical protein [Marivirga sp.]
MEMIALKNRNIPGRFVKAFSVILLITVYFLTTSRIDSVHRFFGHEDSTLHTPEQEQAPCHIAIYHQERSGGCEHKTHFSENDRCSLCDSQVHNTHIFLTVEVSISHFFSISDFRSTQDCLSKGFLTYSSSRAPPAL